MTKRTTKAVKRAFQGLSCTIAALVLVAGAAASPKLSITFTDPVGDATGGAPDIVSASVQDDGRGRITFTFQLVGAQGALGVGQLSLIFLDTDSNPGTGNRGDDYVIVANGTDHEIGLYKWDGSQWLGAPNTTLETTNGLAISINSSELGSTTAFTAFFETQLASEENAFDAVGPVVFRFSIVPPGPPRLSLIGFATHPSAPKAGKPFRAELQLRRDDTGADVSRGSVTCAATIGKTQLKTSRPGHFFVITGGELVGLHSSANCDWNLPGGTRGKTIRGSITVLSDGLRFTRKFALRIG